jgi:hypothetical protein
MNASVPITMILVAAHHNTDNIAAQRYRGLLRYLERSRVRTIVITREGSSTEQPESVVETVVVPGTPFTADSGKTYLVALGQLAFAPGLPLGGAIAPDSWGLKAAKVAADITRREQDAGQRCVIFGSFCPLDAIVAATAAARETGAPLVLDFRDGLGFESFGMQGTASVAVKRLFEARLCRQASALISVSEPLVGYLRARFPNVSVELLPNGFDPAEFTQRDHQIQAVLARYTRRLHRPGSIVIGHFGRLGLSDPGTTAALAALAAAVGDADVALRERLHLVFMGELTASEQAMIRAMDCRVTLLKQRRKPWALALMRACDGLLLLTSDRSSVATGKLFDYLAISSRVLHISLTRNEAAKLLDQTALSHVWIDASERPMSQADWEAFCSLEPNSQPDIQRFSKVEQAAQLELLLQRAGAHTDR